MFQTRIIVSGLKAAWSHKLRAILMVVSVIIGIAALLVVISLGKGTEEKLMSQIRKLFGPNTVMVVAGAGRIGGNHGPASANLKMADVEDISRRVSDVVERDAVQIAPDKQANHDGKHTIVTVSGQTAAAVAVWNLNVTQGRFFSEAENQSLSRVAVIAPNVRKALFGDSDPIGQEVEIENVTFQVIGTVGPRGLDPHGIDMDGEVLVPLNTLLRRVVNLDYLMLAKFQIAREDEAGQAAGQIRQILRERHGLNQNEEDDFIVVTPLLVQKMIKDATRMFTLYLPILSVVALLVGSIVVANLMLISVSERKMEIGLRKAVGATSRDIQVQFLVEASSITVLSGAIGMLLGLLVLSQVGPRINVPFVVSWPGVFLCFVLSTLVGIAAGVLPARKASLLQPVETLR